MNKFVKYLFETIDDEDFFSDLGYDTEKEATFLVDDNIYPKNVKNLGVNPTLKDIENIDHIGTILSNDNGCWLLWNLNNEYWEPFNVDNLVSIDNFGEFIAVCVGNGIFAKIGWSGLTKEYRWANPNLKIDPIYDTMHEININGSGYDSTMNIINNYKEYIKDTIWEHLVEESTNDYQLYLPNKMEIENIWNNVGNKNNKNTNIYKLLDLTANNYWSSSLYANPSDYYNIVYDIGFYNGNTYYNNKNSRFHSVALLHF